MSICSKVIHMTEDDAVELCLGLVGRLSDEDFPIWKVSGIDDILWRFIETIEGHFGLKWREKYRRFSRPC